jgi:hypothetical protein
MMPSRLANRRWLRALMLGALGYCFLSQSSIASTNVIVPSPDGFIEASALSSSIKSQAMAGHLSSEKLIGVYFRPDDLANLLKSNESGALPMCRAYVMAELESEEAAEREFKAIAANAKREGQGRFDPNDPATSRILKRFEDAANRGNGEASVAGATVLGSLNDTDRSYASSVIAAYSVRSPQGAGTLVLANAVAWLRLRKQIIQLSATYRFDGQASITKANETLTNWLNRTLSVD